MEELISNLRKTYSRIFIPTLVVFAILFALSKFVFTEPFVPTESAEAVKLMLALLLLTLVGFVVSYFNLRSARKKIEFMEDTAKRNDIYAKAYNVRMVTMNILSILSSVGFFITRDTNNVYLFVIITLLIMLYYPSERFIKKQIGE